MQYYALPAATFSPQAGCSALVRAHERRCSVSRRGTTPSVLIHTCALYHFSFYIVLHITQLFKSRQNVWLDQFARSAFRLWLCFPLWSGAPGSFATGRVADWEPVAGGAAVKVNIIFTMQRFSILQIRYGPLPSMLYWNIKFKFLNLTHRDSDSEDSSDRPVQVKNFNIRFRCFY